MTPSLNISRIHALTTSTISLGEVTTLAHEVGDDSVEYTALVVEGLARQSSTLLTCGWHYYCHVVDNWNCIVSVM